MTSIVRSLCSNVQKFGKYRPYNQEDRKGDRLLDTLSIWLQLSVLVGFGISSDETIYTYLELREISRPIRYAKKFY